MTAGPSRDVLIVRDVLQQVLTREVATSVLFEALDACDGGVPQDRAAVLEMVLGPLSDVLLRRVPVEVHGEVLVRLELALGDPQPAPEPEPESGLDLDIIISPQGAGFDSEPPTALVPVVTDPVSVVIVAASERFAVRLLAVLGELAVHTVPVDDARSLRHATFSEAPLLVLVDAADPAELSDDELLAALRALPTQVQIVLWASETPVGKRLLERMSAAGLSAVYLRRANGIEPLLDLITSRRKQPSIVP